MKPSRLEVVCVCLILAIGVMCAAAQAQQVGAYSQNAGSQAYSGYPNYPSVQQRADPELHWKRGHRIYYPGTNVDSRPDAANLNGHGINRNNKPITSNVLDHINPCDVNYGDRVDQWRRQIVDETIRNFFFWAAAGEALVIAFLILYVTFLERQKRMRHLISTDIICQLFNAWAFSSKKATTVIAEHNAWMSKLNDEYERTLRDGLVDKQPLSTPLPPLEAAGVPRKPLFMEASEEGESRQHDNSPTGDPQEQGAIEPEPEAQKPSIPLLDAARYQGLGVISPSGNSKPASSKGDIEHGSTTEKSHVASILDRVNEAAAASTADSDSRKDRAKMVAKLQAVEAQNAALRRLLNEQKAEEAAKAANPLSAFEGGE